jgi:hypothetical protein
LLVTLDEPLVRGESERLLSELSTRRIAVTGIVTNRSVSSQPLPTAADVPQFVAPLTTPSPVGVGAIRDLAARMTS